MRRKWCRRRLDTLSIKPRQRAGEKGVMFKLVKSKYYSKKSELHGLQCQKRCVSVSGEPAQKEQESFSFLPILRRKWFVATLLSRNLNQNTLNFVSVVHIKGSWKVFSQFTCTFEKISSASHFPGFSLVRKSFFWPRSDKSFCKLSQKSEVLIVNLEHFF